MDYFEEAAVQYRQAIEIAADYLVHKATRCAVLEIRREAASFHASMANGDHKCSRTGWRGNHKLGHTRNVNWRSYPPRFSL
jgi:hypothetical protein